MVTYVFDFCGGGNYSQSDWQDNMSLFTEQHDLESVAWELSREPFVDERNLFLCGASLGATVTLMAARANAQIVKGCALLYPAFNLHDAVRAACPNRDDIPDSFPVMGMNVSGDFLRSCYDYDFYEHIPAVAARTSLPPEEPAHEVGVPRKAAALLVLVQDPRPRLAVQDVSLADTWGQLCQRSVHVTVSVYLEHGDVALEPVHYCTHFRGSLPYQTAASATQPQVPSARYPPQTLQAV